jgi:TatD DNase family protein
MNRYIDIGVNLTAGTFKDDMPAVVERALEAGIDKLIITGTDIEHSELAIKISAQYVNVCYATVGVHPHHASEFSNGMISEITDMLKHDQVVAVGECGLDFNRNYSSRNEQIRAFETQLEIAADSGKSLFLHQRDAHDDFIAIIQAYRKDLGNIVAHCFTGNADELTEYVNADLFIGVTGWICDDRRAEALRHAVTRLPVERLMLETDAPYLLPRDLAMTPVKKGRNEPCYLPHVAKTVARYMGIDESVLAQTVYANTLDFFAIRS